MTLEELRKIAEAATPGPWESVGALVNVNEQNFNLIADVRGMAVRGPFKATSCGDEARYIATFSPSTVLALLDRLNKAEEALSDLKHCTGWGGQHLGDEHRSCCVISEQVDKALTALREPLK